VTRGSIEIERLILFELSGNRGENTVPERGHNERGRAELHELTGLERGTTINNEALQI
jgi:hypothetical protein